MFSFGSRYVQVVDPATPYVAAQAKHPRHLGAAPAAEVRGAPRRSRFADGTAGTTQLGEPRARHCPCQDVHRVSIFRRIRLRSITTPFGGAGIEVVPDHEKRAVESFFSFLEGRRAMHEHLDHEHGHHVYRSLAQIREKADETLQALSRGSRTYVLVEQFRDACITFFSRVPDPITGPFEPMSPPYREALHAFRLSIGPILGGLEATSGTRVRGGLTKLPRYFQAE